MHQVDVFSSLIFPRSKNISHLVRLIYNQSMSAPGHCSLFSHVLSTIPRAKSSDLPRITSEFIEKRMPLLYVRLLFMVRFYGDRLSLLQLLIWIVSQEWALWLLQLLLLQWLRLSYTISRVFLFQLCAEHKNSIEIFSTILNFLIKSERSGFASKINHRWHVRNTNVSGHK